MLSEKREQGIRTMLETAQTHRAGFNTWQNTYARDVKALLAEIDSQRERLVKALSGKPTRPPVEPREVPAPEDSRFPGCICTWLSWPDYLSGLPQRQQDDTCPVHGEELIVVDPLLQDRV